MSEFDVIGVAGAGGQPHLGKQIFIKIASKSEYYADYSQAAKVVCYIVILFLIHGYLKIIICC